MTHIVRVVLGGLAIAALGSACSQPVPASGPAPAAPVAPAAPAAPAVPAMSPVDRGGYLVNAMGCDDCHTPKKMGPNGPENDMSRRLSGHPEDLKVTSGPKLDAPWMGAVTSTFTAWSGPWGISFTANLTPDQNTGLGVWTEEMFVMAIREGKHMGKGRPILPPMPWPVFRNLNDDDLKGIFAFLRTLPPVTNHVPDPIIAPPPPGAGK